MDVLKIACLGSAAALVLVSARPGIAAAQDLPASAASRAEAAPVAEIAPVAPAEKVAPVAQAVPRARVHHHQVIPGNAKLTDAENAKIDAAMEQVRISLANVRPEIDRAVAQAKADQVAARAVQQAMPQIQVSVARALAEIQPVIRRAVADGRVEEKVVPAMARVQPQIDAALAQAEVQRNVLHITVQVPPNTAIPGAGDSHTKDGGSVTTDASGDKEPRP